MSEQPDRVARDAAIASLVSNLVYVGVVVGVSLALSRREWLRLQATRWQRVIRREDRREREEAAVAQLRRDISRYEHGGTL